MIRESVSKHVNVLLVKIKNKGMRNGNKVDFWKEEIEGRLAASIMASDISDTLKEKFYDNE